MASVPCVVPGSDFWFVGASGATGRRDVLVLTNLDSINAEVNVTLFGPAGQLDAAERAWRRRTGAGDDRDLPRPGRGGSARSGAARRVDRWPGRSGRPRQRDQRQDPGRCGLAEPVGDAGGEDRRTGDRSGWWRADPDRRQPDRPAGDGEHHRQRAERAVQARRAVDDADPGRVGEGDPAGEGAARRGVRGHDHVGSAGDGVGAGDGLDGPGVRVDRRDRAVARPGVPGAAGAHAARGAAGDRAGGDRRASSSNCGTRRTRWFRRVRWIWSAARRR